MLVGKRYAGLIEVADGISEMKTSVEGVTSSISDLQKICHQLKKRQAPKIASNEVESLAVPDSTKQFYSITAQTKLLVLLPSRISDALAQKNFTRASLLLLVGSYVHQGLRLDTTASDATQIFPFFTVISRLWPSIARFRSLICAASRAQLSSSTLTSCAAVDALCAIVALEGVTLRQVFADFLIARSEALNQVFTSAGTTSIKNQLAEGISILISSLKLVYHVFSSAGKEADAYPSLLAQLERLSSNPSPELKSDILLLCGATVGAALPTSVLGFKPTLRVKTAPLAEEQLLEKCQKWFEVSLSSLRASLSAQLAYVSSVKGLAHVRDVTADVLARPELSADWGLVSTAVLGKQVCVWKEAVRPLVLERLEALLRERLKSSVNELIEDLRANDLGKEDGDILGFMWSESSSDIPRIAFGGDTDARKRKQVSSSAIALSTSSSKISSESQLKMKTKGRSPPLQAICKKLDDQLGTFLEDARYFAFVKDAGSTVDLGEDVAYISSSLTRHCYEALQGLIAFIDDHLETITNTNESKASSASSVRRLVFFGRVCEALPELAPRLYNALVPSVALVSDADDPTGASSDTTHSSTFLSASTRSSLSFRRSLLSSRQSGTTISTTASPQDQSLFLDVKDDLLKRFWSAWEAWRRNVVDEALLELGRACEGKSFADVLSLNRLTAWETVEIREEDEEGAKEASAAPSVLSSLRVPVQATVGQHRVLHRLCRRINDAGGYAVPKSVVEALSEDFLRGAVVEMRKAVEGKHIEGSESSIKGSTVEMNQSLATQLSFDAKFLLQLLSHRGTAEETRQQVEIFLTSLETFIDPFDLDLLNPHLRARVLRHAQRSAALYGLLTMNARGAGGTAISRSAAGGMLVANERASTLTLCGGSSTLGSRFPTIPLPTPGSGKDPASRRHGAAGGASSIGAAAARRKEEEAQAEKAALSSNSPLHKAATWSAGLSKLSAREGSNSPSDFFKSGAALYVSWFGGGGGGATGASE